MGWGATPADRAAIFGPKAIFPKTHHSAQLDCTHVVIDGNAAFRQLATHETSAQQIIKTFVRRNIPASVKSVAVFFDRKKFMMPQRAELHARRYANAKPPENPLDQELFAGTTYTWTVNHNRKKINYKRMFETSRGKAIAMEIFARTTWLALIEADRFDTIVVDTQDERLQLGTNAPDSADNYGEADQRIFYALREWQQANAIVLTVDSDSLLQTIANITVPPPKWIKLKNEVISGRAIVSQYDASQDRRISAAMFLIMAYDTDYNRSLSRNGYYKRDVAEAAKGHHVSPITCEAVAGTQTYSNAAGKKVVLYTVGRGFCVSADGTVAIRTTATQTVLHEVGKPAMVLPKPPELTASDGPSARHVVFWPRTFAAELSRLRRRKTKKKLDPETVLSLTFDALWTTVYFAGFSPNHPVYGGPPPLNRPSAAAYTYAARRGIPILLHREHPDHA